MHLRTLPRGDKARTAGRGLDLVRDVRAFEVELNRGTRRQHFIEHAHEPPVVHRAVLVHAVVV